MYRNPLRTFQDMSFKALFKIFFPYFLGFGSHKGCLGLAPGSALMNNSWRWLGEIIGVSGIEPVLVMCKASALVLSL